MTPEELFDEVIRRLDAANGEDPNLERFEGSILTKELIYGIRMTAWVECLDPHASETLRLAARAQHLRRWEIPRENFPMNRAGYHRWRTALARFHADSAARIMEETGYGPEAIERVRGLLQKKNLKSDEDTQTLEDAAALVFLERDLESFAQREDMTTEKVISILQKTWVKMSDRGHEAALALPLSPGCLALIRKALA